MAATALGGIVVAGLASLDRGSTMTAPPYVTTGTSRRIAAVTFDAEVNDRAVA
jgi:hypothetical protein